MFTGSTRREKPKRENHRGRCMVVSKHCGSIRKKGWGNKGRERSTDDLDEDIFWGVT